MNPALHFVACTLDQRASQILDILNEAMAHSTARDDYQPRTMASIVAWFQSKTAYQCPVIGAVDTRGTLLGFASDGTFRAWATYRYMAEHAIYVHKDHRCKGISRQLLQCLVEAVHSQPSAASIWKASPTYACTNNWHAGTIRKAAFKFGRWLDLGFYQLTLGTPAQPAAS